MTEPRRKISELTEAVSPLAGDLLPIVSGGATKRVQAGNLIKVISGLNEAASPVADDLIAILRSGVPKKMQMGSIFSDYIFTLLAAADAATARATLGITAVDPARGFISGLTPSYKDADEITFRGGQIEMGGVLYSLEASLDVDMDARFGAALMTDAWHIIYLNPPDSGTTLSADDFEVSGTSPVWDDAAAGRYHPSVSDWRALGAFKTDGSGNILPFKIYNHLFSWGDPRLLVSASAAVSPLTALGADVPFDTVVFLYGSVSINTSYSGRLEISQDGTNSWYLANLPHNASTRNDTDIGTTRCATNGSKQIYYKILANGGSLSATIEQLGFLLPAGLAG